jgi:hypothetical protein
VKKQFGKIHIHFGIGISHLLFESKHRWFGKWVKSENFMCLLNEISMIAAIKGLELPNDIIMQTSYQNLPKRRIEKRTRHRQLS